MARGIASMHAVGEGRVRLGVRARATLGAVAVVGVALAIAAVALVTLLDRTMTSNVRSTTALQARSVADLFETDAGAAVASTDDDQFVQVLDDSGAVVASTPNVEGRTAIADLEVGGSAEVEVSFDDDPFLVVAASRAEGQVLVGRTLDQVVESTASVSRSLAVGVPLLLMLVGSVTWILVGRALEPVERIRAEVDEISTSGLDRRVPEPASADEIGRLARTMNRMLERLQSGQAAQRRFVSDASHELRSPVATIRQHAELALARPEGTTTAELAEVVLAEDLRLQHLVEDLLTLARMDEGASEPTRRSVDLDDIVLAEAARLKSSSEVTVDAARVSGGRLEGDPKQLTRLVANLLDNSARHGRSKVSIALGSYDGQVRLIVDDDGAGIPAADRQRVFERFVRLEDARDRRSGGTGLGLAIVAEVASAHGGTVSVDASPLGGSRFVVTFPAAGSGPFSRDSGVAADDDEDDPER